jgi:hypothetical protein
MSACTVESSNRRPIRRLASAEKILKSPRSLFPRKVTENCVHHMQCKYRLSHVMFQSTAALGPLVDLESLLCLEF